MRPRLQALLSRLHGAVSQGLAGPPRADEEALCEAELARVVGGTDGLPPGIGDGIDLEHKAAPILF